MIPLIATLVVALFGALTCSFMLRQAYLRARFGRGLVPQSLVARPLRMVVTLLLLTAGLFLSSNTLAMAIGALMMGGA
ncbi:MAG: hypothetical protein VX072_02110 [Pseudomonadota bacterium]|nr:hypothetical protein [Pseudomonadota bacterium]